MADYKAELAALLRRMSKYYLGNTWPDGATKGPKGPTTKDKVAAREDKAHLDKGINELLELLEAKVDRLRYLLEEEK